MMIVTLARVVDSDVESSSQATRRFEARQLALTGIAYGMNAEIERGDPLFRQELEDGSELEVAVTSESARINVNSVLGDVNDETLDAVLDVWEVPEEFSRVAVDSLRDWTDENELRSLNGAEAEDLVGQSEYSIPENRDFISVSEMERVRGVDAVISNRPDWAEIFSVHSDEKIDVQDAGSDVLRAVSGMSSEQADLLIETRNGPDLVPMTEDDLIFENLDQVTSVIGLTENQRARLTSKFGVGSEPTRIESAGTVGGVRYVITVIADRGGAGGSGAGDENEARAGRPGGQVKVLSWEEG
ncbi:MAG: hypothetical protein WA771_05195 [Chthoniobacterales bacterium]